MDGSACNRFEPQKWRKTKCKHCFEDINRHTVEDKDTYSSKGNESKLISDLSTTNEEDEQLTNEQQSNDLQNETCLREISVSELENFSSRDLEEEQDEGKNEGPSPETSRKPSYETASLLSRFSTVEFSSCSSLASFDALEDTTVSSYSYSGSRDNLDGFTSGDELSFGDTVVEKSLPCDNAEQMVNVLEDEIDNLRENQKLMERNKDRQIQALDRELQNLKLELTKYSARENMTILKKRLEIEGKNLRIEELENEVQLLESTIDNLNRSKFSEESQQDVLEEDLKRRKSKIQSLEEEKRTLEERLSLAEDLQQNDRELLEVLRSQLTGLEKDLLCSEDKNKHLEERVKELDSVENNLEEEKANLQKANKQIDFLSGKLKLREQHVSYLEDDNVSLQQQNQDLESKLKKSLNKAGKLSNTIKDLEKDIDEYNKEIEHLNAENSELEHGHWQAIIEQADASGEVQNYIQDLEKRVNQNELKVRDLEFENEAVLKESSKLLDDLVEVRADYEEAKKQLNYVTENYNHTQQLKCDQDKRVILVQRKLKKLQKEKKRFNVEKTEFESKISEARNSNSKISVKCDEIEKGYKMIQLKLQSTEAKMTMLEGNKIYLESKINEYEKKYNDINHKLVRLNNLVNEYVQTDDKEDLAKQEPNFDLLELNIRNVLDRNLKKLEAQRWVDGEETSKAAFTLHDSNMKNLSNSLSQQANGDQFVPTNKTGQYDDICDSFEVNLKSLKKQNEILESELCEVFKLKSVLNDIDSDSIVEDITDAELSCNGIDSQEFPESYQGDILEPFEEINLVLQSNELDESYDLKSLSPDGELKVTSPTLPVYSLDFDNGEKQTLDFENSVATTALVTQKSNANKSDDISSFRKPSLGQDGGSLYDERNILKYNTLGVQNFIADKVDAVIQDGITESVNYQGFQKEQCTILKRSTEITNLDACFEITDPAEASLMKSDASMNVKQGQNDLPTEGMFFEDANTGSSFEGHGLRSAVQTSHVEYCQQVDSVEKFAEKLAFDIFAACGINEMHVSDLKDERNIKLLETQAIEDGTNIVDADMESERPVTSVRCIFEIQPNTSQSLSTCSEGARITGRKSAAALPKASTFPRAKKRAANLIDDRPFELTDDFHSLDKTKERWHGKTPYYSVAMSQIETPKKDPGAESIAAKERSVSINDAVTSSTTPNSFWVSQENLGAITLTIPSTSLEDAQSDSDESPETIRSFKTVTQGSAKSSFPAVTLILEKPQLKRSDDSTNDGENPQKNAQEGDLAKKKVFHPT